VQGQTRARRVAEDLTRHRAPVQRVEQDRRAGRPQVHADLMVAAGQGARVHQRDDVSAPAPAAPDDVAGEGVARAALARLSRPRLPTSRVVQGDIDLSCVGRERTERERHVVLLDLAVLEGHRQRAMRVGRTREDDEAGRLAVESMHDPHARADLRLEPPMQAGVTRPASGRDHRLTGVLRHGDQVGVLMEDRESHVHGRADYTP
jgi:hypothetical protein